MSFLSALELGLQLGKFCLPLLVKLVEFSLDRLRLLIGCLHFFLQIFDHALIFIRLLFKLLSQFLDPCIQSFYFCFEFRFVNRKFSVLNFKFLSSLTGFFTLFFLVFYVFA